MWAPRGSIWSVPGQGSGRPPGRWKVRTAVPPLVGVSRGNVGKLESDDTAAWLDCWHLLGFPDSPVEFPTA